MWSSLQQRKTLDVKKQLIVIIAHDAFEDMTAAEKRGIATATITWHFVRSVIADMADRKSMCSASHMTHVLQD